MSDGFEIVYNDSWLSVRQRLLTFSEDVTKKITVDALKATAAVMKNTAQEKAPNSSAFLTAAQNFDVKPWYVTEHLTHLLKVKGKYVEIDPGNLKKFIRYRKMRAKNLPPGTIGYQVYVALKVAWYAKFVEYGTSKTAAQPFFRPAFEENAHLLPEIFRQKVDELIGRGGYF